MCENKKICMIVHSYFPSDPRVYREAKALILSGYHVDVICLRNMGEKKKEVVNRVNVYRLPVHRDRTRGPIQYLSEYISFFFLAFLEVSFLFFKNHYILIQVHTMPDFLIFSAILPKLLGAKTVLDIHDLMPEGFMYKFGLPTESLIGKLLKWEERLSATFADYAITVTSPLKEILTKRSVGTNRIAIVINAPDDSLFSLSEYRKAKRATNKNFIIMYHGLIYSLYDVATVIRAVRDLKKDIPNIRFNIFGDGPDRKRCENLVEELSLQDCVIFYGKVPIDKIPFYISIANLGIVPLSKEMVNFLGVPTRIYEYVAMSVPVVVSRSLAVEQVFPPDCVAYFDINDRGSLLKAVLELHNDQIKREQFCENAKKIYEQNDWQMNKKIYLDIIEKVISGGL